MTVNAKLKIDFPTLRNALIKRAQTQRWLARGQILGGFRRLREGDPVEPEFTTGPKGHLATFVRRIVLADPPRRLPRDENGDVNGNR